MSRSPNRRHLDITVIFVAIVAYAVVQIFDKSSYPKPDLPEFELENTGPFAPTESYHQTEIAGWQFFISHNVYDDNETYPRFLYHLEKSIVKADSFIPEHVKQSIRPTSVWIEEVPKSPYAGRFYHPFSHDSSVNPQKKGNVELNLLPGFARNPQFMMNTFIHEIAHVYHNKLRMSDKGLIARHYRKALASSAFQNAKILDPLISTDYALTNAWEYFAELSAAYIIGKKTDHKTLSKLYEIDPEGMAMISQFWNDT